MTPYACMSQEQLYLELQARYMRQPGYMIVALLRTVAEDLGRDIHAIPFQTICGAGLIPSGYLCY